MAEVPSRLYAHLSGSAEEIVARLESLDLLLPWAPGVRAGAVSRLQSRLTASPPLQGAAPSATGQTLFSVLQTELFPFLNDKGRELAGRRGF